MAITAKGFIFSFDLAIAFIALLLMLSLILTHTSSAVKKQETRLKDFELTKNAAFTADSLVKNSNEEKPLFGAAGFNTEKHRVESNSIDMAMLASAKQASTGKFAVTKLSFRNKGSGTEQIVFEDSQGNNCVAISRFVLVNGKKGLVEATVCR